MIKIVNGIYGPNRLNAKSAPFTLSEAEEKRLVDLGVAEYVSATPADTVKPAQEKAPKTQAKAKSKTTKGKKAAKK